MECTHCENNFSNKHTLLNHQQTAKYCLKIQKKEYVTKNKCEGCKKTFTIVSDLNIHRKICKADAVVEQYKLELYEKDLSNKQLQLQLYEKDLFIKDQKITIKELQDKLENIAIKAVQRPFEYETVIDIDDTIHDSDNDSDEDEDYQLTPLEVGQGFTIEHREEDGYINVTNLCKAGGKLFKNWKKTQKTKAFLQVLSSEVPQGTSDLIKLGTGSKYKNSQTWVHPQVAINIAQWISPQFDVKVSGWVYEIMMTGTVDITNTKSYKELRKENKTKDIKIQYLTKKYMKAQPRIQYGGTICCVYSNH